MMREIASRLRARVNTVVRAEPLLSVLILAGLGLETVRRDRVSALIGLVDWQTIAALAGLIVLTQALMQTGVLQSVGSTLLRSLRSERALALGLVALAAALSAVLTNDVALFILVPLTVSLAQRVRLPVMRLVVFEALAVNVGSALTPIGNPQNLFLWQRSGVSALAFTGAMGPFFLIGIVLLVCLTFSVFAARRLEPMPPAAIPATRLGVIWPTLALYMAFLVCVNLQVSGWGLAAVLLILLVVNRAALAKADWALIAIFVMMFADLRMAGALPWVSHAALSAQLDQPAHLFFAGIISSQFLSNVPATILLSEYSADWQILGLAANVGGFGIVIGSLANIIALRLHHEKGGWWMFHAYSIPFCGVMTLLLFFWTFR